MPAEALRRGQGEVGPKHREIDAVCDGLRRLRVSLLSPLLWLGSHALILSAASANINRGEPAPAKGGRKGPQTQWNRREMPALSFPRKRESRFLNREIRQTREKERMGGRRR